MKSNEIIEKIDKAISCMDARVSSLNKKIHLLSDSMKSLSKDNFVKYQYELEKNNYYILKANNDIVKAELFKKRCRYYKELLKYYDKKDILNIKRNEYNFIKTIQDEVIFYYDSKENELKQRATIEKIVERDISSYDMIKELQKDRDKKYDMFLKKEFFIDPKKIYTLDYLNYNIDEVTKMIYQPKGKRKAS